MFAGSGAGCFLEHTAYDAGVPGSVQSIERAASVLRVLSAAGGPQQLGCVAETLGLAKSTTHGILRTLVGVGFVEHQAESGSYRLSGAMAHLAPETIDVNELRSRAMNWVDALAARTRLGCRLVVLESGPAAAVGHAVVAHEVFSWHDGRQVLDVGAPVPLHATASGKVLLAFDPRGDEILQRVPLEQLTFRTRTERRQLGVDVGAVRQNGYAVEQSESQVGVAALAAPVRSLGGITVAALAVSGPVEQVVDTVGRPRTRLLGQLVDVAAAVSRAVCADRA